MQQKKSSLMGSIQQILTNLTIFNLMTLFLKYALNVGFNIFMKQVCLKGKLRNAIIFRRIIWYTQHFECTGAPKH